MKRVTGIGGIFFKSEDPKKAKEWYRKHFGLKTDDYGCAFWWKNKHGEDCTTQWSPFKKDTEYFQPSQKEFMLNFSVDNLTLLFQELKKEGITVIDKMEDYDYGKFGWILDPEGNKIELWESKDNAFS